MESRRKPCISSIPQGIAYHQHKVLYIIKPTKIHAKAWWYSVLTDWWYTKTVSRLWWYTKPVGLDRKKTVQKRSFFYDLSLIWQLFLVKFWLRQSDVMLRIVMLFAMLTVMWCVPYHVPKAHFTSKGNITHEVLITFRLRNTSLKKDGYKSNRLFSGSPCWARTSDIMINSHALYRLS